MIPRRIWIVGPCGAGKSTMARRLASAAGIPAFHLDDIFWQPGWKPAHSADFERAVRRIVTGSEWIIDGNYAEVRQRFMGAADLIVWLDLPMAQTFPRLVWRCARRAWHGELICNGNHEPLLQTLAGRESILWWALRTDQPRRRTLRRELRHHPHVRLRSQVDIDAWLHAMGCASQAVRTS